MSIASKFKFTGEVLIPKPKDDSHSNYYREWLGGKNENLPMRAINFGVKESSKNVGFVELMGIKNDVIKTMDKDNNKIEVPWEDRNTEEAINLVAYYRKHVVDLGEEFGGRQEFITEYDTVEFLANNLKNFEGKITVTGQWKKNAYNGKITDRFEIRDVYAVPTDSKPKLQLTMDFFYNDECIDDSDFKEDSKIYVNGYVQQYVNKEMGNAYFPQQAILSAAKYDMENEVHKKKWEYRKKYIEKLPKKKMYHILWECRYINGSEEVDFDESMLTDRQREQIEFGIRTIDDFKPKGAIFGNKISEIRLFDPVLTGDYSDGIVECEDTISEFEDKIFNFAPADEKMEDVLKPAKVEDSNEDEDIEDLF